MLTIGDFSTSSRLLLGTAQYPSLQVLVDAIVASRADIITVSLRRESQGGSANFFWEKLKNLSRHILPNTAGCYSVKEAVVTAEMARELFETNWIKLEIIGDAYTLQPNVFELIKAAEILIQKGFEVFPYCTEDLIVCQRLLECGCRVLMPWASPIGSGQGIINPSALRLLRKRFPDVPLIIDAGIGKPSQATQAMEMGFDAMLINSAVALSNDPVIMADAFAKAVEAGRSAYLAGLMPSQDFAKASTPVIGKAFSET
jgi:thiazole synthase